VTVFLAGTAGIAACLFPPPLGFADYIGAGFYSITIVAAIATLIMRKHQIMAIGLLLGLWCLSVPFLAEDIAIATVDRTAWGLAGNYLTSFYVGAASDLLGVAGAILLWSCCKSNASTQKRLRFCGLSIIILCSVGLSQIAALVLWVSTPPRYAATNILGIATLVVGPAVAWYALRLRASRLGGMILLGWIAPTATVLTVNLKYYWASNTRLSNIAGIIESILLITVAIVSVVYLSQSRVSRRLVAAATIVLLAGAFGLASNLFSPVGLGDYIGAAFYSITILVAVLALIMRKHQITMTGLLLGLWCLSVPFVIEDIVIATADRAAWGLTGSYLTSFYVGVASDVLGVAGAILLWSCCQRYGVRKAEPRLSTLSMVMLWGVGLSQIAALVMWIGTTPRYAATETLSIGTLIVGPAIAWYALRLRPSRLGGMIVLGWVAGTATLLAIHLTYWWSFNTKISNISGVIEAILLAIVAMTAIIFIRKPVEPEASVQVPLLSRSTP
jgi:hypothetical protein